MGILDDLKQEAERVRRVQEQGHKSAQGRSDLEGLRDRMVRIHHYLSELVDHLNVVGWKVVTDYAIPGIGDVEFHQGNYRIYIDDLKDPKRISLRFECAVPEIQRYSVTPRPTEMEFRKFLKSQQTAFSEWPIRAGTEVEGASFQCRLRVLVSLLFEACPEDLSVNLATHNFDGLLDVKLKFHYERIDDDWLDQLGHYVLRKDRRLTRLDISEDVRRQIRQRLEEDNRRRMLESAGVEAVEGREGEGLFARLSNLLRGSTRK